MIFFLFFKSLEFVPKLKRSYVKYSLVVLIMCSSQFLFVGCSFAPIGENKFDCNRKDSPNEYCRSIKAVERSTQGELPETRYEKEFDMHDYDRAYSLEPVNTNNKKNKAVKASAYEQFSKEYTNTSESRNSSNALGYSQLRFTPIQGAPIRVAPIIQRIYIKSYVDANDVLVQDQIIYKEIAHSKWSGFEQEAKSTTYKGNTLLGSYDAVPHRLLREEKSNVNSEVVQDARLTQTIQGSTSRAPPNIIFNSIPGIGLANSNPSVTGESHNSSLEPESKANAGAHRSSYSTDDASEVFNVESR